MLFALGTLAFLATLWMLVVVGARVLEHSGGKIAAALKGESGSHAVQPIAIRARHAPRHLRPVRASARLRAAA